MKNKDIAVSKNKISNNLGKGVILKVFNFALIEGNIIYNNGGGIYLENANYGNCIVVDNTIYGNSYGIYWTNVDNDYGLCLKNNSITNNNVGIRCVNGSYSNSITYNNCWNNTSSDYSGDLPPGVGSYTNVNINGTVCDAYYNISDDPEYTNVDSCDFSLKLTSSNIDAGDPDLNEDPDSTISDIGAIYFNQLPYLPSTDFTSDITSGNPPLSVQFIDQSGESDVGAQIDNWSWDFGDGNTSNAQNPIHEYQNNGIYTVSLTITDTLGFSDTEIKEGYINVFATEIHNLKIFGEQDILHIVNPTPIITFEYFNSEGEQQSHYHIQVSTDSAFSVLDMWDSGEIASSDTSVIYDGQELQDGKIYYLRARVAGGDFWSDWSKIQFKMNSKSSIPVLTSPINNEISGVPVILNILNSTDAENDNLTYSFNVYSDAALTTKIDSVTAVTEGIDTTSWKVIATLIDNEQYWWTASANDGYEESTVSNAASFLLNSANDAPNAFALLSPADSTDVITLTPLLDWEVANDPDPLDTVSYNLYFGSSIPDLQLISVDTLTSYRILYPLSDNTNYYWKVISEDLSGATTENTGGYRLFRVNTENEFPNPFSLITPTEYSVEIDLTPIFVWENKGDPDGDELTFNMYYSMDSSFTETVPVMIDSNNFIPVDSLMDNSTYFWKVIAKDSGLLQTEIDTWCFWTNTELEPPNPFDLLLPKDGENILPIVPEFVWSKATDNDPNDYAVYNLLISKDETFSEVDVFVEGLTDTSFVLTEGLDDNNQYYWKIEAIDTDSLLTSSEVFSFVVGILSVDDSQGIPAEYSLSQNYPNPFNPTTTISYQLPRSSFVKLTIYDISGRLVDKLIDEKKNAGYYFVEWNAKNVCSGVYFYRIEAGSFVAVKKGLLVK